MCVPHVEQKCRVNWSELWYRVRADRSGVGAEGSWVMLMYEVRREPEMRREVVQLQRCDAIGSFEFGSVKVWVAEAQEQDKIRERVLILRVRVLLVERDRAWMEMLGQERVESASFSKCGLMRDGCGVRRGSTPRISSEAFSTPTSSATAAKVCYEVPAPDTWLLISGNCLTPRSQLDH